MHFFHKLVPMTCERSSFTKRCGMSCLSSSAHRRRQWGQGHVLPKQIFRISSHFVLWETVSETKYFCSPDIKNFATPHFFSPLPKFLAGYATASVEAAEATGLVNNQHEYCAEPVTACVVRRSDQQTRTWIACVASQSPWSAAIIT